MPLLCRRPIGRSSLKTKGYCYKTFINSSVDVIIRDSSTIVSACNAISRRGALFYEGFLSIIELISAYRSSLLSRDLEVYKLKIFN
jgi:hypothetical protein